MNNLKFKRFGAYLIDILIVSLFVVLINQINFINPNKEEYLKTYNEYVDYYEANFGNITTDTEINTLINDDYAGYMYDLQYYAISNSLVEIIVITLYFTLFPKFNNNQTIGKRLFKIKLIHNEENEEISFWQYLIRSVLLPIAANIIMYNTITSMLNIGILFIFKGIKYLYANLIITYIVNAFCYADIIAMFVRKDNRTIHDLICKTKVVDIC